MIKIYLRQISQQEQVTFGGLPAQSADMTGFDSIPHKKSILPVKLVS
jgi:hypothetical protein